MYSALRRRLTVLLTLTLGVSLLAASLAPASGKLKLSAPSRGATYLGTLHSTTFTVKVSNSGKTATVGMSSPPVFCSSGGGGEVAKTKPAKISSKQHTFTAKLAFSAGGSHKSFANVTVRGTFYGTVLQGTVKSVFPKAKSCGGQESFEALAG